MSQAVASREITRIEEVLCSKGSRFTITYDDGDRISVPIQELPPRGGVLCESPILTGSSDRECPLCGKSMDLMYSYRWPVMMRMGKVVAYDRDSFFENPEGYHCLKCGKMKVFGWETRNESRLYTVYSEKPDWHIRYSKAEGQFGPFAINETSGTYRTTCSNGVLWNGVSIINKEMTEQVDVSLIELSRDADARELVYRALAENIEAGVGAYIVNEW